MLRQIKSRAAAGGELERGCKRYLAAAKRPGLGEITDPGNWY